MIRWLFQYRQVNERKRGEIEKCGTRVPLIWQPLFDSLTGLYSHPLKGAYVQIPRVIVELRSE